MKWSRNEILNWRDDEFEFEEDIRFPKEVFLKNHHLRNLEDVNVRGELHYEEQSDLLTCHLSIRGTMILPCAITNEDVYYDFDVDSIEVFAFRKVEDSEDLHEAKGDVVELLPIIFQTIMMEVPLKVVKEGLSEYPKGEGWEVIKESDYKQRKENEVDPRLAKLKEFKIEED